MFLGDPIVFDDKANSVCLPGGKWAKKTRKRNFFAGKRLRVSGWGQIEEGGPLAEELKAVELYGLSNRRCQRRYYDRLTGERIFTINNNMLCASVKSGTKDSCRGDSGGK